MTIEKAIKRYSSNAEYERTHGSLQGCLEFKQLADWLKELKQLLEQTRWIPVSERMPETTDYYLVTVGINEYGLMIPSVRTALYNAKTKDFTVHTGTNMCIVGDVIAWCECLLEPCKAESEEVKDNAD